MTRSTARDSYRVQSAERLLDVLEAVAASATGLRAGEIATQLGLPFSTTHRLAALLARRSYLSMDRESRRYHLGPAVLRLRGGRAGPVSLEEAARPLVQRLAIELGETAFLAVPDGQHALVLCAARPQALLSASCFAGMQLPLHATAAGKCLLAFGPAEQAAGVMREVLRRCTERTLVDPHALAQELALVRADGYAREYQEYERGLAGLAVPVGSGVSLVGALAIAGPCARFDEAGVPHTVERLRAAAAALALLLAEEA